MNSIHPINRSDRGPAAAKVARAAKATKATLRAQLRRRRRALDAAQQAQAARDLAAQLQQLPAFARARRIAFYLACDGEIDPAAALAAALARGAQCYAPVIADDGKILRFAEITARAEFRAGRFGIAEPVAADRDLLDARALDLALLPLVGFDRRGNRIGMGGGFYDATFAAIAGAGAGATTGRGPLLVVLAHEIQRVDAIDAEAWDIPLTAVVTDRRIHHCAGAGGGDVENAGGADDVENAVAENESPSTANPEATQCATG